MLAQGLGQCPRVDAGDAGYVLALEPVAQALYGVPMAVVLAVVAHDDGLGMNLLAFHEAGQPVLSEGEGRHTIVAHQWIGQCHQLSRIAWVGQALGVSRHRRVEDHLARHGLLIAERLPMQAGPVVEDKGYVSHSLSDSLGLLSLLFFFLFFIAGPTSPMHTPMGSHSPMFSKMMPSATPSAMPMANHSPAMADFFLDSSFFILNSSFRTDIPARCSR